MGIVHPLMYENEDTLIGQIGYGTGTLHNSDKHAMTWCRNFDGGKSFTTTLGHNWQFAEPWFQQMILNGIEWTADQAYANCVTYVEVAELLAAGGVGRRHRGRQHRPRRFSPRRAPPTSATTTTGPSPPEQFVEATRTRPTVAAAALAELHAKGQELISWAKGLK